MADDAWSDAVAFANTYSATVCQRCEKPLPIGPAEWSPSLDAYAHLGVCAMPIRSCGHPWFRRAPFVGLPIVWRCASCGGLKLGPGYERAA